jgi:hypothetical protein
MQYLIAGLIGVVSGVVSGLFGVGGGVVMVPAMMYFLGLPVKTAIGTSLMVIIPVAVSGSYKHFVQGNLDWRTAVSIAPMAIVGGYTGAWLTSVLADATLKRLFGAVLVVVGLRLLLLRSGA